MIFAVFYVGSPIALIICYKTLVFLQLIFAVFHTNNIKYANGVVNMPIFYTSVHCFASCRDHDWSM